MHPFPTFSYYCSLRISDNRRMRLYTINYEVFSQETFFFRPAYLFRCLILEFQWTGAPVPDNKCMCLHECEHLFSFRKKIIKFASKHVCIYAGYWVNFHKRLVGQLSHQYVPKKGLLLRMFILYIFVNIL